MDQSRPLFVYFHSFLVTISVQIEKKQWWCAWDSNLGPQDGRRRQNHGAMAATPVHQQLFAYHIWVPLIWTDTYLLLHVKGMLNLIKWKKRSYHGHCVPSRRLHHHLLCFFEFRKWQGTNKERTCQSVNLISWRSPCLGIRTKVYRYTNESLWVYKTTVDSLNKVSIKSLACSRRRMGLSNTFGLVILI